MSNGMRVDLSALDEVIRKLLGLLGDMESAKTKAKYETNIPSSAFGSDKFLESNALHAAHEEEKVRIENIIRGLHDLIEKFGTSASKVKDKYAEQEMAVEKNMGGGSGGPKGSAY
ncbi:hypothetical protein [Streptomyces flavidovirens]|uniref:Uncharacterized protein n=1 Tax=Streptomyces flavidovirens TaxID=67298 RepID=A0ABW6RCD8_9ACTN